MNKTQVESPTAPPAIRLLLIALLPLIAALLYLDGQHYDSDLLEFKTKSGGPGAQLFPDRLSGLDRAGQVRSFNKDNLYEYINGHAEYYIGAGFKGLTVGEYGIGADGQPRLVINLYDLGTALNAFGVLVNEAGEQTPVDIGSLGFRGKQGVNFIHGPYYAQLSIFDQETDALDAARELAGVLQQAIATEALVFRFPDLGRPLETRFVREYYRGMEFFNQVLERSFERDGLEFQAFTLSAPAVEIQAIAQSASTFLSEDGIPFSIQEIQGLKFHRVADPYEGDWFFVPLKDQLIGAYASLDEPMIKAIIEFAGNPATGGAR